MSHLGARCWIRSAVVLACLSPAGACGIGDSGSQETSFPSAPAGCAGPSSGPTEKVRQDAWSRVREDVERAGVDDAEIWMSFAKVLTPEEAGVIVDQSPVGGVLLAYEVEQGPSVKVTYAPVDADPTDIATMARAALERGGATRGAGLVPTDPAVASGAPPVVGVLVRETGAKLSKFVSTNTCLIYSVESGQATDRPVLSPIVASD